MSADPASKDMHPATRRHRDHINPDFIKLLGMLGYGRVFTRASGTSVWDHQGHRYLDFLAGFGAVNIGHNHPRLRERIKTFLDEDPLNFCHIGPQVQAGELAEELARLAGGELSLVQFSSSGAEAVEVALKMARAATGRTRIVSCAGGFHGTNLGTLSVMGSARMRSPFEPLLPGCETVEFGNLEELERSLSKRTVAGFLAEPIQGEAGVVIPPVGYWPEAARLCREAGTLLLLDEVQTGLGRVGHTFAYQGEGFLPDVLILAKGLSGSLAPIGATLTSPAIHHRAFGSRDRFDLVSSTFGGNALSCVTALETLRILAAEDLVGRSRERGQELLERLRRRIGGHPLVRQIRGRGLLMGIELGPKDPGVLGSLAPELSTWVSRQVFGQWVSLLLLEEGIICQPASQDWNVLKVEPPLTVDSPEIGTFVEALGRILERYDGLGAVLADVARRLSRQYQAGWSF